MDLDKITNDMCRALNYWYVYYDKRAIEKIASTWNDRKSWLRSILSKHPLWREQEQAIIFDYTQIRDFNREIFLDVLEEYQFNMRIELSRLINQESLKMDDYHKFSGIVNIFKNDVDGKLANQSLVRDIEECVHKTFTSGTKNSRIFNSLMLPFFENDSQALANYNHYFAKIADVMNPIEIKKYTCLSIHPADFLLMSNGTRWRSCHRMDDSERRNGCLSYLLDDVSMILYTVSSKFDESNGDFYYEPKIDRQIYCFDKYDRLLQSRLYPQDNEKNHAQSDEFRHLVQGILAECLDVPNLWKKSNQPSSDFFRRDVYSGLYDDWNYSYYYTNVSHLKNTPLNDEDFTYVGAAPMCLRCGDEFNGYCNTDNLYCDDCSNTYVCENCGNICDKEDMHYIDGKWYCDDCVFYCEYHEEYEPIEDKYDNVEYYGDICEDAYDTGEFVYCYHCGDLYPIYDTVITVDGDSICNYCVEKYYLQCDDCEEYFRKEEYEENPDGTFCPNCIKNHQQEAEENEISNY